MFAVVEEPGGQLRRRGDDSTRFAFVKLNAEPTRVGDFEYLRGPVARPVVRELDELGRAQPPETHRYTRHSDTVREDR